MTDTPQENGNTIENEVSFEDFSELQKRILEDKDPHGQRIYLSQTAERAEQAFSNTKELKTAIENLVEENGTDSPADSFTPEEVETLAEKFRNKEIKPLFDD